MRALLGITCGAVLACGFAAAHDAAQAKRALANVTLRATVSKTWDTVTETTVGQCPASIHSIGKRQVVLRSARPTKVVVRVVGGRASFSPSAVRFVTLEISASGQQTTQIKAPCQERTERVLCQPVQSVVTGRAFRFFRSSRNEISFRRVALPELGDSCPRQSAAVQRIRPGLHDAEGGLSERALVNRRIPSQTALADALTTNELDGDEVGRVVEHVHWALRFERR